MEFTKPGSVALNHTMQDILFSLMKCPVGSYGEISIMTVLFIKCLFVR